MKSDKQNTINLILPKRETSLQTMLYEKSSIWKKTAKGLSWLIGKQKSWFPVKNKRLYFLAGPIMGGGDWQKKAIKYLSEKDPGCYIACPCRYDENHELFIYSLPNEYDEETSLSLYPRQTIWEREYLERASLMGAIIFWLPVEDSENPRPKEKGPYGRDTYGELGEWRIRLKYRDLNPNSQIAKLSQFSKTPMKIVIGAESDFSGLSVIRANWQAVHGNNFIISPMLEDTLDRAIKKAKIQ